MRSQLYRISRTEAVVSMSLSHSVSQTHHQWSPVTFEIRVDYGNQFIYLIAAWLNQYFQQRDRPDSRNCRISSQAGNPEAAYGL
jgi:hypothetical protein